MIGVTIGVGDGWRQVAEAAANRMSEFTKLRCVVMSERFRAVTHPSWLKCKLIEHFPNEDSFMVFDADLICLRPWKPKLIFEYTGRAFCAVPDTRLDCIYEECEALGISFPDIYINGGLTIFGSEHKPIWDEAWRKHPRCGKWLEQGALNLALLESNTQMCRLPRRFNVVTYKGRISDKELCDMRAVNVHACAVNDWRGIEKLQKHYFNL
jgi:hypothetical protein